MGSTPLGYCWFIYKIGARTGRLTGQFETYAHSFGQLAYRSANLAILPHPKPAMETIETVENNKARFPRVPTVFHSPYD